MFVHKDIYGEWVVISDDGEVLFDGFKTKREAVKFASKLAD